MKIRSHLALFAVAVLTPVVVFSGLIFNQLLSAEREAALRGMQESVRAASLAGDAQWNRARGMIDALARSPYLRSQQFAAFHEQAKSTIATGSFYIVVFDELGQQRVNTSLAAGAVMPSTTEVAGPRVKAVLDGGHAVISSQMPGSVGRRQIVSIESPVVLASGQRYVISYGFDAGELLRAMPRDSVPADWRFTIFDRDGVSIARGEAGAKRGRVADKTLSSKSAGLHNTSFMKTSETPYAAPAQRSADAGATQTMAAGPVPADLLNAVRADSAEPQTAGGGASVGGVVPIRADDGGRLYAVLARSPVSGWTTSLEVPAEQIEAASHRTMFLAALGLLTALCCAIMAGVVFGGRIVHAFEAAVVSARALGEGQPVTRQASGVNEADRLNEALAEAGQALERANGERDKLLLEAEAGRGQAETRARAKDQFLATLGHELRNPLAPISTAAHILKLPGLNEDRLEQTRGIIERQVANLTRLVDELIDVSRVARGTLVLQNDALDLNSILSEAVEQVRDLMEERHHELIVNPSSQPAWVNADGARMIQVLTNLLHNAAKFTAEAGHIELTVKVSDDSVAVTVKDDGNGIPADFQPHVFDLFAQSNRSTDHSQGGLGLGLSLVKGLVELHDGSVSVSSAGEGMGSEFRVELPRLALPSDRAAKLVPTAGGGVVPVLNVVVVDDNVDAAESLAMYLKASFGYRVWVYADAQSALTCSEHDAPDAFVLDIGLPGIDGYELARRLRQNPLTAHALLIAVTGYGQQRDRERALEAGFDHHMTKPADPMELAGLLAQTVTE